MYFQILWHSITGDNRFLITPSITFPRKFFPPDINNSLFVYLFLPSELKNGGMKLQVQTTFKSYFFVTPPKKQRKTDIFLKIAWTFFARIICMKCLNLHVIINKVVNEHTVDSHPSPSELIARIHSLIFL